MTSAQEKYNEDLAEAIKEFRGSSDELASTIDKEETRIAELREKIAKLEYRRDTIDEDLLRRTQERNEYDKTIQETETAYKKILTASRTLIHVLQRESVSLAKKKGPMNPI
eukprot:TRINITY_DN17293_c0_g2_i1.p2 TRINITY_DN17293_c0_g2~~TRINITY_DN17293_c0_g2_i1.p2  ORF type:complete len:111 (+),score=29.44 TRINITY_DN17293_c0_g2_i1:303-635(+)